MFDFLKRLFGDKPKKSTPKQAESTVDESDDPDLDPEVIFEELKPKIESFTTTCIGISTKIDQNLKLENSKFGGLPYFPIGIALPKDVNGKTMRLLAQLNFSEIPEFTNYPTEGLLQFFIEEDEVYGMDFDNPISQKGWRVLFFEKIDFEPRTDLAKVYATEWDESPLHISPLGLTFAFKKDYPTYPSIEYYRDIHPLFEQVEKGDYEDFLSDIYMDQELSDGHKIGGFPYYTQNEIREFKDQFLDYQLLFQIDSDEEKIMWGDVGVANFFIKKDDLIRRDFSKVLYNWDCH